MIRLAVRITLPSGKYVTCGDIVCTDPDARGRMTGAFRYDRQWLDHKEAFPLDPNELPLSPREYTCTLPTGVFPVFEDSLPDDWGRRLLVRKAGLSRDRQSLIHLLQALNGSGMGALSYYPDQPETPAQPQISIIELERLVDSALKYEAGKQLADGELHLLFAAASSPGGARPKALVRTDDNQQWIAKFPSAKDTMAMVPMEAATLALADGAGVRVPDFRVESCGKHQVLLVKRFDITPHGGRRHMLSFQTLLQAQGYYTLGYTDLLAALRKISAQPQTDIPALYRQMIFNALIGNTDDHLKNFCLLHDDRGFYLSPAYDLLPDTADRREHVLHFHASFHYPGRKQIIALGKHANISSPEKIFDQIKTALLNWQEAFTQWGVPRDDIARLAFGITRRLGAE